MNVNGDTKVITKLPHFLLSLKKSSKIKYLNFCILILCHYLRPNRMEIVFLVFLTCCCGIVLMKEDINTIS